MGIEINVPSLRPNSEAQSTEWGGAAQTSPESGTSFSNDKGTVCLFVFAVFCCAARARAGCRSFYVISKFDAYPFFSPPPEI